jgi:hypothetical protein
MFHSKTLIALISVFFSSFLNAQEAEDKDTTKVVSYTNKLNLKINLDTQTDSYTLINNTTNDFLKLKSNNDYRLFFSLDYEFIGFSIGFSPKFLGQNNDENIKGKSKITDYRFRLFLGKWIQGFQFNQSRGFYVENTTDFIANWQQGDPYIQIPSLKNTTYKTETAYIFNPNFSFRSIVSQTEIQKKSCGSFIPSLSLYYYKFSFDLNELYSKEEAYNGKLALSYYYNLILHENWFISPFLSPAYGYRHSKNEKIELGDVTKDNENLNLFYLEGGLQVGYRSKTFFWGGNFNFNNSYYKNNTNARISNDKIYGLLYFGYRFEAPKILKKQVDWLKNKTKKSQS